MTKLERTLLEHVLDLLDRLYDNVNGAADVHDLLIATRAALSDTRHAAVLDAFAGKMEAILRASLSPDQQRDRALGETDELRKYLADFLDRDTPLEI